MSSSAVRPGQQEAPDRGGTPLPTRVSAACARCRRNKSRCDAFRPCSLCLRANAQCVPGTIPDEAGSTHRAKRIRTNTVTRRDGPSPKTTTAADRPPPSIAAHERHGSSSNTDAVPEVSLNSNEPWDGGKESPSHGELESTMGIARKIYRLGSQRIDESAINAIPGANTGDITPRRWTPSRAGRQPVALFMVHALPPDEIVLTLLEEYFSSVHWFSLVVYEPRFRSRFQVIRDGFAEPGERPFLALLSTMLGMAAWYTAQKSGSMHGRTSQFWLDWSNKLIQNAELLIIDLMDQNCLPSVQTLILLGSHYVYHGRPNLSFSLLGATIRAAQAIGLHREVMGSSFDDAEEKKRVWWTIYTWDRFASLTWGRPLGINDKDCNLSMPADIKEDPFFTRAAEDNDSICFSAYQRELNKLYMIASPVIEDIYGNGNRSRNKPDEDTYSNLAHVVTQRLWTWKWQLPAELLLDLDNDCSADMSMSSTVHRLQSLALQLTFDNLLIILHRPFLTQQIDSLHDPPTVRSTESGSWPSREAPGGLAGATGAPGSSSTSQGSSPIQWWHAAVRISRVTELPRLAQAATETHLVAFLAINLFNSAIVMVVHALPDPLSDKAQEAKRTITRIFRLQELLGKRSTLSLQSSTVLRSVIHMLLRREAEVILSPISTNEGATTAANMAVPSASDVYNAAGVDFPALNTESQLTESLASVQRVFTSGRGDDRTSDYNQEGNGTAPPENSLPDTGPSYSFGNDDSSIDPASNGLYWFWDTIWDENCMY